MRMGIPHIFFDSKLTFYQDFICIKHIRYIMIFIDYFSMSSDKQKLCKEYVISISISYTMVATIYSANQCIKSRVLKFFKPEVSNLYC